MGDFTSLQYERTGDLVQIAINRPPFNVLDIATMAEMNLALDRVLKEDGAKVLGGGTIDAREAHAIGLVNKVFPRETFAADTAKFLDQFLSLSRAALLHTKRAMRVAVGRPFAEALHDVEQIYLKEMMATEDATEGLNAFMEKRKPVWKNR